MTHKEVGGRIQAEQGNVRQWDCRTWFLRRNKTSSCRAEYISPQVSSVFCANSHDVNLGGYSIPRDSVSHNGR